MRRPGFLRVGWCRRWAARVPKSGLLLAIAGMLASLNLDPGRAATVSNAVLPRLTVGIITNVAGSERLTVLDSPARVAAADRSPLVFQAIPPDTIWPAGWVPIFAIEVKGSVTLARLPPVGEAHTAEPLFFALPPAQESGAAAVAGTWICRATHPDGQRKTLGFDLAVEGMQVAGRFDPGSDYRFASINQGTLHSHTPTAGFALTLEVEWVGRLYQMEGTVAGERIQGTWRQVSGEDQGTWEARRPPNQPPLQPPALAASSVVNLYEWQRVGEEARRYRDDSVNRLAGWERAAQPLCRVWRPRPEKVPPR